MQAHEPKTVRVDFRELQNGWVAATSEQAPGMFVADKTRDGVDLLVPEALMATCADAEHACDVALIARGPHTSTFKITPHD